jgi:hypothetical protein
MSDKRNSGSPHDTLKSSLNERLVYGAPAQIASPLITSAPDDSMKQIRDHASLITSPLVQFRRIPKLTTRVGAKRLLDDTLRQHRRSVLSSRFNQVTALGLAGLAFLLVAQKDLEENGLSWKTYGNRLVACMIYEGTTNGCKLMKIPDFRAMKERWLGLRSLRLLVRVQKVLEHINLGNQ